MTLDNFEYEDIAEALAAVVPSCVETIEHWDDEREEMVITGFETVVLSRTQVIQLVDRIDDILARHRHRRRQQTT